jgi:hypothetical protein
MVTDPGMNDGHLYGECAPNVGLGNGEGEDGAFARLEAHNLWSASVSCVKFNVKTTLNVHFTCNKNIRRKNNPIESISAALLCSLIPSESKTRFHVFILVTYSVRCCYFYPSDHTDTTS